MAIFSLLLADGDDGGVGDVLGAQRSKIRVVYGLACFVHDVVFGYGRSSRRATVVEGKSAVVRAGRKERGYHDVQGFERGEAGEGAGDIVSDIKEAHHGGCVWWGLIIVGSAISMIMPPVMTRLITQESPTT